MAIRTYDILLDSYNSTIPEPIVGRQGDKNGAVTLHVTITDRGTAVDLTGQTINLMAETAKGTAVVADNGGVTLTDAKNGRFDYAIPNALWSEAGKITKAYFSLNDSNGQQTTYDLFFIVKIAADMTKESAKDWVSNLNEIIEQYNQWANDAHNSWEDFVNENKAIIESIDPGGTLLAKVVNGNLFSLEDNATYLTEIGGIIDDSVQCVQIDESSGYIYTSQAEADGTGVVITRLLPTGDIIDAMEFVGAGHGTLFGVDDGKIWLFHKELNALYCVDYKPDVTLASDDFATYIDYAPSSLTELEGTISVTYDSYGQRLLFLTGLTGSYQNVKIYNKSDILAKIDNKMADFNIEDGQHDPDNGRYMQGLACYGDSIYWSSSGSTPEVPMMIQIYDLSGKKISERTFNNVIGEHGINNFADDFVENEGLFIRYNANTDKLTLLFILDTGGSYRRRHTLYAINQRGNTDYLLNLINPKTQQYPMLSGDGRVKVTSEDITSISQLINPGYYYIDAADVASINDLPYPDSTVGWFVTVSPLTSTLGVRQDLIRNSFTRAGKRFSRYMYRTGVFKSTYTTTDWDTVVTAGQPEFLEADWFGGLVSNVTYPGEYIITTTNRELFTDLPTADTNDIALRLEVSSPDTDGNIYQRLYRQSSSYKYGYFRIVDKNKKATAWAFDEPAGTNLYTRGSTTLKTSIANFKQIKIIASFHGNRKDLTYRTNGANTLSSTVGITAMSNDSKMIYSQVTVAITDDSISLSDGKSITILDGASYSNAAISIVGVYGFI